jgi:hypothetical protein
MGNHETSENSNNQEIKNTDNQLPVSISDLIKNIQENLVGIRDNPDFQIKSS